jgi:glycosyltransferase involved in cell wall biosynthesis
MTMRVLHIDTESGWRGGENQLRLLVIGLAARGVESHVAARPGSAAAIRLAEAGARVVETSARGGFSPRAAWHLARYCDAHEIAIVHAHTANAHSLGLLVKRLRPELKLVVHRRVDYAPGGGLLSRHKYLTTAVDRYVAISEAVASILVDYGVARERIALARSAVPLGRHDAIDHAEARRALAQAYGVSPTLTFIGNASALTHQKGYEPLLDAFAVLKKRGVPFHGFIAGDGDRRDPLEKRRIELGLEHDVTFLGFIEQVPPFLAALDVLAVPSRFEGLGTIILDGIDAGLCVVASRVGGIPEVIEDGETGLLAPVEDVATLAAQLEKAARDPALRRRLNAAAKEHVARSFSVDAMVEGNLAVYRQLEPSRNGSAPS